MMSEADIIFIILTLLGVGFGIGLHVGKCTDKKEHDDLLSKLEFKEYELNRFVDEARDIWNERNTLEKRNHVLIEENNKLKEQIDKQSNVTYNYYINKEEKVNG